MDLRNLTLSPELIPLLFHIDTMFSTAPRPIASRLLISCTLLPLVLIRVDKISTSSIFSPSRTKSSLISLPLSTTMIFVFCVLSKMFWHMLASLTFLSRPSNTSLLVNSKVVSSANRKLVYLLPPIVIPSWYSSGR